MASGFNPNSPFAGKKKSLELNGSGHPAASERLVSAGKLDDDDAVELKLRPKRLAEFIGQSKAKEQLAIALEAAKARGEALDHVLLFGPPGLGKTTLATIIANELEVGYQQTSGPALQIGQDRGQVALDLQRRPRSLLKAHIQLIGNDGGQGRLAQPRRPKQQHVI